jgi:hypothetical protein
MIRYPITEAELWRRIDTLERAPNWRTRAQTRLNQFVAAGRYSEPSGIWSEIKPVYVELQHSKCGYCEKPLEDADFGLIEHDVEHYRPKSRVRAYPPARSSTSRDPRADLAYDFSTGDSWDNGYFRLAYHPLNYLTTCKTCNSALKSDYFPIAGGARIEGAEPRDLAAEEPFLLYPLGDGDAAPEELIGFEGITAVPVGATLAERRRARVTIDFFQLNNRDDLRRQRANVIHALYLVLEALPHYPTEVLQREARRLINSQMLPQASHSNCSRCFVRLFQSDPQQAATLAVEAKQLYSPAGGT